MSPNFGIGKVIVLLLFLHNPTLPVINWTDDQSWGEPGKIGFDTLLMYAGTSNSCRGLWPLAAAFFVSLFANILRPF